MPVLIAGPTASGKSALALAIAERQGGVIVNADALQVYDNWRILTARPGPGDLARAPHALYGHVGPRQSYSVGHWLRDVAALLDRGPRLIITGGTGLYFTALTEGLAEIPPTPPEIRAEADRRIAAGELDAMLAELDPVTAERIDRLNPVRVQRAWEVQRATGRGLAGWQDDTGPPLLPLSRARALLVNAPPDWLAPRIAARFDAMLAAGALEEARQNLADWDPARPSAKAIGGPELIAHLRGEMSLDSARDLAIISSRQYAKRQRSWFRSRMKDWPALSGSAIPESSQA
ncbi:tRNA (adenosine(37)-N6)-dimethylallyltransferase MiaA [Frigidibacter sp. ROC022]|uniref:tRNA (adenosine(37)-N6)-dimethylallyltransferase MiaA n=1 Tax=Frigidibacter sp. ROC022 TaxID=2971796 RepID=UPI00215B632A|nr:tRNA (adenosine(37)-N6)-dimethylallyltransferase MiaA [Frigidibacter sp. ROC022]MCR8723830.1 tRNA (adenosine(37)-N6)-dimethylallyltransferase MiaA [Frigidibacter sp. ROC022]